MPRTGAEKLLHYRRRRREQGLRRAQLWTFDRGLPEFRQRLWHEAELVRGHASTLEANAFLSELLDQRLVDLEAEEG